MPARKIEINRQTGRNPKQHSRRREQMAAIEKLKMLKAQTAEASNVTAQQRIPQVTKDGARVWRDTKPARPLQPPAKPTLSQFVALRKIILKERAEK